jgi:putative DNA primase/helicase
MARIDFIYRKAEHELFTLIDKEKIRAITADEDKTMTYISKACDLIREALEKSSLSTFNGIVYCFTGRIYEPFPHKEDFANMVHELWSDLGLKKSILLAKRFLIVGILRDMVYSKEISPDSSKVVFDNGVYDVERKEFTKSVEKNCVCLTVLPYNYNSRATCPNWQMFLDSVLPKKEYQKVLQEFVGSAFIDRGVTKIETMLVLKGNGANGKSVVLGTLMGVLGKSNISNISISELIQGNDKKMNIAKINGKRLNYCPEINAERIQKESDVLKALISGEPVEARALYGNNFTAYDVPLMMCNCNRLPRITDWTNGMRRRLTVIPFDVTIPKEKQNPNLVNEFAEEYSGIFNWIIEGRDRFRLQGCRFTFCEAIKKQRDGDDTQTTATDEDLAVLFMLDNTSSVKKVGAMLSTYRKELYHTPRYYSLSMLYLSYCRWCKARGMKTMKRTYFKELLIDSGYSYVYHNALRCFKVYIPKDNKMSFIV